MTPDRRAAIERFFKQALDTIDSTFDDPGEAIAAMADHVDAVSAYPKELLERLVRDASYGKKMQNPTLQRVCEALEQLSDEWSSNGMGPDGAFVNVSGDLRRGDPQFPHRLALMLMTHVNKNAAYVGDDPDPLANYVNAGYSIGIKGYEAAFQRLGEKASRGRTAILQARQGTRPVASDGEAMTETLMDIAVIALLTCSLWDQNR